SHEKLERLVGDEVRIVKLRERVTAGRVEAYFNEHRSDFDVARIARLEVADEGRARQLAGQVRGGAVDFCAAARRCFLARRRPGQPLFAALQRRQTPPELAAAFTAAPGDVIGPVRTEAGYTVACLLSRTPARLDEATAREVRKVIFEQWLARR